MERVKVMHQCGHNTKWNIISFIEDKIGDGLIISPADLEVNKVNDLPDSVKSVSYFDPQYYLPTSEKKKLNSYPFFPKTYLEGRQYSTQLSYKCRFELAKECVQYQKNNNYKYIVIPTIYEENFIDNTYDELEQLIITPFIDAISRLQCNKPVLLTAMINKNQLIIDDMNIQLLNFLTSYPEIDGIYLIPIIQRDVSQKRISGINLLFSLMKTINALKMADLEVHLGYTDVEGYLLTIAGPNSISIGAYENSRRFDIKKFGQKGRTQQPNARLYSNVLLQWIDTDYIDSLFSMFKKANELFENNEYLNLMLRTSYNWHFTKKEPYMHYFTSFSHQVYSLHNTLQERYNDIYKTLINAKQYFSEISESGVVLDAPSSGGHIDKWITALNRYATFKGVRINVQN